MVETEFGLQSQAPTSAAHAAKSSGGRQRVISSCLTCRRRKVKCDHTHPICGSCTRGSHACTWADHIQTATGSGRVSKAIGTNNGKAAKNGDVQARLDRLEQLLEKAVASQGGKSASSVRSSMDVERPEPAQHTPSSTSQTSHGGGIASDDGDGTLLLDGGQSQFVSSLHYALLADEIQDIKALLGDQTDEERREVPQSSLVDLLSLGRARSQSSLVQLLPDSQEHRDTLLDVYFANVDPMVRITHKPTVLRKFLNYNQEAHPISFAIYFSAINSLPTKLGVEITLARENYLTTSNLEIFQGFVLWLTCITREEDMGKAWVLLGLAFRIALNQGLHRDPSLFPIGSMDTLTIESRRRMWHQLGHLEFRAAECKGQEPSISEDFYTTLFPRNIDDDDLVDGASPGPAPYDEQKFTTMSFQLVRYTGMRALRRIVQSTYRLERRMLDSGLHGTSQPDPAQELRNLYEQIKVMLDEVHEENHRKYLHYLNPEIPMQRLTLGLASLLEWRSYLLFWLRMPRAYRDVVFSEDIRRSIFEKSVNCIETLNGAAADVDAARFQWHIGGIASFQAIMHVLSELRNPLFDAPDRQRALRALQMSRTLRENNSAKAWQAVKNMIDKAVAEHNSSPRAQQSQSSSTYASPPPPVTSTLQPDDLSNGDMRIYPPLEAIPSYAYQQQPPRQFNPPNVPLQAQPLQSVSMDPVQVLHDQTAPSWDDFSLSNIANIVGDVRPAPGGVPDFDFVSSSCVDDLENHTNR
ncbi:hypothetical protein T440DRAFT_270244 [Plenodomus tracheiphilus IPT5]|uniref:Zn(2)-C6 fungal-type domain-containing protein n=1 Tax=Plenodomus tracheiphilus IPT5 TaxID=1408161 RepID=A0A6A7BG09_9PLEO|nr:hypothetical protein T440DRAFT_270244 [Plenodomus tracheiphilus IPT5]